MAVDSEQAVAALSALAHESRLAVFRMLIQQGPDGLSAGDLADHLGIQPPVLSFHLAHLSRTRLVTSRRCGRSIIYAPNFETMDELNIAKGRLRERGAVSVNLEIHAVVKFPVWRHCDDQAARLQYPVDLRHQSFRIVKVLYH